MVRFFQITGNTFSRSEKTARTTRIKSGWRRLQAISSPSFVKVSRPTPDYETGEVNNDAENSAQATR